MPLSLNLMLSGLLTGRPDTLMVALMWTELSETIPNNCSNAPKAAKESNGTLGAKRAVCLHKFPSVQLAFQERTPENIR